MNIINQVSHYFSPKPLISEDSANWILLAFEWAIRHFDAEEFFNRTQLIKPSNDFFPGRVDSIESMAETVFQHTLNYSGLGALPFQLSHPGQAAALPQFSSFLIERVERNSESSELSLSHPTQSELTLPISYNPQQTLKPGDLASSMAQGLAFYLMELSQTPPPGGEEYKAEATEVLACFMGFGLLLTNSAYTYRGACGSCYNPYANRVAALTENESLYLLALFTLVKDIPDSDVLPHLKKHLKSSFKQAKKQIVLQADQDLKRLKSYAV